MYWVEIQEYKITGKGESPALSEGQIEIPEELYNQLLHLPATFSVDNGGNIVSVIPAPTPEPEPQPPTQEERLEALELAMLELVLGGDL